jgi:hypothetical protein
MALAAAGSGAAVADNRSFKSELSARTRAHEQKQTDRRKRKVDQRPAA